MLAPSEAPSRWPDLPPPSVLPPCLTPAPRSIFKPQFAGPGLSPARSTSGDSSDGASSVGSGEDPSQAVAAARWFLTDRIASLREAFRRTPKWLGFNIELKYPTALEVAAMRAHWWSRNHFVDAILKVRERVRVCVRGCMRLCA